MYEWNCRVRYSETDADGKLSLLGILNYFQDCTNFDSEDLGVGLWWLNENHLAWILLTWQIEVLRYPKMGEEIVVGTFPYAFKGAFGYRNFCLKAKDGQILAYADSTWMLVDTQSFTASKMPEKMTDAYKLSEKYPMDYTRKKIAIPDEAQMRESFVISPQHLDTNHHVNNGQYVGMAMAYLPGDCTVTKLRVEYRKQAFLNDEIVPKTFEAQNEIRVSLNNTDGMPFAVLQFETVK